MTAKLVLGLVGVGAVLSAGGTAALCHRYEQNAVSDVHIVQMLDRMVEQQALATALARLQQGDLKEATDLLTARVNDNATAIQSLVTAAGQRNGALAQALAETMQPRVAGAAMQAQVPVPDGSH